MDFSGLINNYPNQLGAFGVSVQWRQPSPNPALLNTSIPRRIEPRLIQLPFLCRLIERLLDRRQQILDDPPVSQSGPSTGRAVSPPQAAPTRAAAAGAQPPSMSQSANAAPSHIAFL